MGAKELYYSRVRMKYKNRTKRLIFMSEHTNIKVKEENPKTDIKVKAGTNNNIRKFNDQGGHKSMKNAELTGLPSDYKGQETLVMNAILTWRH